MTEFIPWIGEGGRPLRLLLTDVDSALSDDEQRNDDNMITSICIGLVRGHPAKSHKVIWYGTPGAIDAHFIGALLQDVALACWKADDPMAPK